MDHKKRLSLILFVLIITSLVSSFAIQKVLCQELKFDHNHTFAEVVKYLNDVVKKHPKLARLHTIGKSYLGNDLLVLEITNMETGQALEKPGYWIDGNLHASEVMGAEVCLKTIQTLVTQYGQDDHITNLVNTRTIYIMPKLNPDGSDHYLTKPDRMRSSVRPHDTDRDGALDEDPPEDLDSDGYITQIRIRDKTGPMKTSPDDPRLLVRCKEDEPGEWRVYSEGIDNDEDGRYNEDGVGGLDINRNWPGQWKQEYIQRGAGPYPLSEPETRAVAEFLFIHPNVTGVINHHMSGNFVYRPPNNRHFDPITGEEEFMPSADESIFNVFGKKYTEILEKQPVRKVYGRGGPPRMGAIWGVMIGWAYDHYGVFSWVPEMGSYNVFCDYDSNGTASQLERLKWNDTEMDGNLFVDWKTFDHPQLGKVEIGGFKSKIYNPKYKCYTNVLCTPGEVFETFLANHTQWNLYMVSMSPLVHITDAEVIPLESKYFKIIVKVQNQGYLPTNVTEQAIVNETAKTVKAIISLKGAELVMGKQTIDLGHLDGNRSSPQKAEWLVRARGRGVPNVVIKAVSEKGGTDTKILSLK